MQKQKAIGHSQQLVQQRSAGAVVVAQSQFVYLTEILWRAAQGPRSILDHLCKAKI